MRGGESHRCALVVSSGVSLGVPAARLEDADRIADRFMHSVRSRSTYFKKAERAAVTPVRASYACGQAPSAEEATAIAGEVLSSYYAGEIDRVELMYTSFISMIASVPAVRTMIPLQPGGIEMEGDEIFKLTSKDGAIAMEKEKVPAAKVHAPPPRMPSHPTPPACAARRIVESRPSTTE